MTDFIGNKFHPGDYVLVARRRGSSTWLARVQVVSVDENGVPLLKDGNRTYPYRGSRDAIAVTQPAQASA